MEDTSPREKVRFLGPLKAILHALRRNNAEAVSSPEHETEWNGTCCSRTSTAPREIGFFRAAIVPEPAGYAVAGCVSRVRERAARSLMLLAESFSLCTRDTQTRYATGQPCYRDPAYLPPSREERKIHGLRGHGGQARASLCFKRCSVALCLTGTRKVARTSRILCLNNVDREWMREVLCRWAESLIASKGKHLIRGI